jgi:hypothetical protein
MYDETLIDLLIITLVLCCFRWKKERTEQVVCGYGFGKTWTMGYGGYWRHLLGLLVRVVRK